MNAPLLLNQYMPDDLLQIEDSHRFELVDGRMVERPMGAEASQVALSIGASLRAHVRANQLGSTFGSDCGYVLCEARPKLLRFPDASFVSRGRLPDDQAPAGHIYLAPDLAVEVVSPNDNAQELDEKIEEYLQYGVRLVWVAFPRTQAVMVYRADGAVSRLHPKDDLTGEAIVPGFQCRVAELFAG